MSSTQAESSSVDQPTQSTQDEPKEEELDVAIKDEILQSPGASQTRDAMNLDGANDGVQDGDADGARNDLNAAVIDAEPRIPAKKDATLREFLGKMDDYAPIIPDAVTNHYLTLAGLPPPPQTSPQLARLLALATQKFIADVAADAYQYARIRTSHTTSNTVNNPMALPQTTVAPVTAAGGKESEKIAGKGASALGVQRPGYGGGGSGGGQGRTVLTMEDLGMAVGDYGVNVKRSEFYR